jgi:hypothetical protein
VSPTADAPMPGRTARGWWVFAVFVAIAAYLIVSEHRAHLVQALPWLFVLACPLMHLFMHRGHAHHGGSVDES